MYMCSMFFYRSEKWLHSIVLQRSWNVYYISLNAEYVMLLFWHQNKPKDDRRTKIGRDVIGRDVIGRDVITARHEFRWDRKSIHHEGRW